MSDTDKIASKANGEVTQESLDDLFKVAEAEAELSPQPLASQRDADSATSVEGAVVSGDSTAGVPASVSNPDATYSHKSRPKPCIHTFETDNKVCPICLWPFCKDCASGLDEDYCHLCLDEPGAELRSSPLIDQDGQQHEGRLLTPGPTFNTLAKRISEMSISELEAHISHYKGLIKQAETSLDFRRVSLGMGQVELAQRQDQQRRRLRGVKIALPGAKSPSKPKAKAPAANLGQMLAMLEALKALQAKKAAQGASVNGKPADSKPATVGSNPAAPATPEVKK